MRSGESCGVAGRDEARNVGGLNEFGAFGVRSVVGSGLRGLTRGNRSFSPGQDGVIGVQGFQVPDGCRAWGLGDLLGWGESEIGERNGDRRSWWRAR
jgi:hypothetical protein